ncbi:MAG: ATP-binding protein [Chitinophagaceae bacterium]|nr:MAG: ATP-binding protein [Chitinophagaceae bacterium]
MIKRTLENKIKKRLFKGKVILLLGPRQVGKTTLAESLMQAYKDDLIWLSGDEPNDRERIQNSGIAALRSLIGKKKILVVDEAQRISNAGLTFKIIADKMKHVQVLATGSSAFELSSMFNEPLTGRKYEYTLFPLSFTELSNHTNPFEETSQLENRLIYGSYPEVVNSPGEEKEKLSLLSDSYLYKDLFAYEKIKKPSLLSTLLKALALQMGSEVSYNELGQITGADKETVEKYIDLLEKAFIVFRLNAFNRNVRNELKKSRKIYFYDNGIRNAIIGNYAPLSVRQDKGALWENYLISERWKKLHYAGYYGHRYFWRTTQQQEIDYVEEIDGKLSAYEIKWNAKTKTKFSTTFLNAYNVAHTEIINKENYHQWLGENFET